MKAAFASVFALAALLHASAFAQKSAPPPSAPSAAAASSPSPNDADLTPAQTRISAAKRQIVVDPKRVQAFNDLALANIQRARETADPKYLEDADQALAQGLRLDAKDFQLQKTQIALLLSKHLDLRARELAAALNVHTPDDVMLYGFLAQADLALGNYGEAEKSAQWMLNMLPNNVPGLLLAAQLRNVYGDADGALDLLNMAYGETSPVEVEEQAWIANQIASVNIEAGKIDAASSTLARAEELFPHYPYTLENLARVRLAQHRPADAVLLLQQAARIDHSPHVVYDLAQAQNAAGQAAAAKTTLAEFSTLAARPGADPETTRDLILQNASDPGHAAEALRLAQAESATRHDVASLDALAWALYANAKFPEADVAEQKAIAVGVQNAQIFAHASRIAEKLKHPAEATKDFALAARLDPSFARLDPSTAAAPDTHPSSSTDTTAKLSPPNEAAASNPLPASTPSPSSAAPSLPLLAAATPFAPVPAALLVPKPTETARIIRNAQAAVARNEKNASALATLGAAYFQRARETGDVSDYQLAEQALTRSLDLVSSDFSADAALGTMAEVCMGEHRFADALTYSQRALSLGSGDVSPFAIVGDADADMGEYTKAAAAYARLTPREMTLSPRAAYARDSRLSYLKFIAGDTPGAIALMKTAVSEGTEAQLPTENLAWLYYELGEYNTQAGDAAAADVAYLAALNVHPGDYRALAGLGKLRANQGRDAEAIVLYQRAIAVVPMPIFVGELGDLYARSGNQAEAKKQFALVVYIGMLGHINQVLHNRDLALFYADHDTHLPEALALAQKEFEVRHDVYTWDAFSWALYKNGKYAEAAKASENALKPGTRDSLLLFHAGAIAEKLGQRDQARSDLKQALAINPHFHLIYADEAQKQLSLLNTQAAAQPVAPAPKVSLNNVQ